jgi:hypothetical protein
MIKERHYCDKTCSDLPKVKVKIRKILGRRKRASKRGKRLKLKAW